MHCKFQPTMHRFQALFYRMKMWAYGKCLTILFVSQGQTNSIPTLPPSYDITPMTVKSAKKLVGEEACLSIVNFVVSDKSFLSHCLLAALFVMRWIRLLGWSNLLATLSIVRYLCLRLDATWRPSDKARPSTPSAAAWRQWAVNVMHAVAAAAGDSSTTGVTWKHFLSMNLVHRAELTDFKSTLVTDPWRHKDNPPYCT